MKTEEIFESKLKRSKQIELLILTSIFWALVAAGVMVTSLTLPKIAEFYKISANATSLFASVTFFGMLFGAFILGNIADIIGRKSTTAILTILVSIFNGLIGLKLDYNLTLIFRFIAGFGMGGLLPVVNAYLTEFLPKFVRGRYLVILEGSWAIGSIIIGIIAVTIGKTNYSYTYFTFFLGILTLLLLLRMPESIKFLIKKGRIEEVERNLKSLNLDVNARNIEVPHENFSRVPFFNLFKKEYLGISLTIWFVWFAISFSYYTFFTWLPKVISNLANTTITKSLFYTFFLLVMQLPGYLLGAYLIEAIGRKKSLFIFLIGTSLMAFIFALSRNTVQVVLFGSLLTIFCMSAWGIIYAYTPELFPTEFRATANGSSGAFARVAGIIAPLFISYFLSKNLMLAIFFFAILLLIGGILVLLFGKETKSIEIGWRKKKD